MEVTLRGLCEESHFDTTFYLDNEADRMPLFRGKSRGQISWSVSAWKMITDDGHSVAIRLGKRNELMPIGRHNWMVTDPNCGWENENVTLSLSACDGDTDFSCSDGTCVPIVNRCDLVKDCSDGSDEMDCGRISFSDTYNKFLPPPHALSQSQSSEDDAEKGIHIGTSLEITLFNQISTLNEELEVTLVLEYSWKDPQLLFFNLRDNLFLNMVPRDDAGKLWVPDIKLENAKEGSEVTGGPSSEFLSCRKRSSGSPTGLEFSRENLVYGGRDNELYLRKKLKVMIPCPFELTDFPFDEQNCCIRLRLTSATKSLAHLEPENFTYSGPMQLKEFEISSRRLAVLSSDKDDHDHDSQSEIVACFRLHRSASYHLITTFFQTLVLGGISYATLYINVQDLRVRFTGSLTALLVLVSLLNASIGGLPKTSNIKLIDVWFISLILGSSVVILLHILIDKIVNDRSCGEETKISPMTGQVIKEEERKKRDPAKVLNNVAKILVPIFFVCFNAGGFLLLKLA